MARKGKEPAGLRRYRLAQKRKRSGGRKRRVVRAAPRRRTSSMARRRKGRRKKNRAIPLAVVLPPLYVGMNNVSKFAYAGPAAVMDHITADLTGYQPSTGTFDYNWAKGYWMGQVAGVVVHKAAGRFGLNRHIKKLTMGWLEI